MNNFYIVTMSDDDHIDLYETSAVYVEQPDIPLCSAFDSQGYVMDLVVEEVEIPHKVLWFSWNSKFKQVTLKKRMPLIKDDKNLSEKITNYLIKYHQMQRSELRDMNLEALISLVKGI